MGGVRGCRGKNSPHRFRWRTTWLRLEPLYALSSQSWASQSRTWHEASGHLDRSQADGRLRRVLRRRAPSSTRTTGSGLNLRVATEADRRRALCELIS